MVKVSDKSNSLNQALGQEIDRRSVLGYCVGGAAGAVLLGAATPSRAALMNFKAAMSGTTEVPPNQSAGTGTVTAAFDPTTKELTWSGSFSGL